MKSIKNTFHTVQFRGICSKIIYTLVHYLPCKRPELQDSCKTNPCPNCEAYVTYQDSDNITQFTTFCNEGIKDWRI